MNRLSIKVLIVDDSIIFRTKLQLSLSQDKEIEVVGSAINAKDAMGKIEELNPDVVTLDVEMPGMNGIEFLKTLIPKRQIPVVVVSSLPINALDALDAGAVDFVKKPDASQEAIKEFFVELTEKVKVASKAKVKRMKPVAEVTQKQSAVSSLASMASVKASSKAVIAIGASTGGTEAIIEVVKDFPENTPGVVIVQHMPPKFTDLYAQRLDKICKMHVKEAEDYDRVVPGQIIIAAGEYHLTLKQDAKGYYIRSQRGEKVSGHCPSVDVMFDSVAKTAGKNAVGVILTGMGADGAKGIKFLKDTGAYTIGQDKETCVVYGMPMEAYKIGGISRQLPLDQIGSEVIYQVNKIK